MVSPDSISAVDLYTVFSYFIAYYILQYNLHEKHAESGWLALIAIIHKWTRFRLEFYQIILVWISFVAYL